MKGLQGSGRVTLPQSCSDRTGRNGIKLKEGKFRLDICKKFPVRVGRHWVPRSAVAAPSLEVSKVGQGLEQPGAVEGVPAMAGVALDGL